MFDVVSCDIQWLSYLCVMYSFLTILFADPDRIGWIVADGSDRIGPFFGPPIRSKKGRIGDRTGSNRSGPHHHSEVLLVAGFQHRSTYM